jgi:hypothetical protein
VSKSKRIGGEGQVACAGENKISYSKKEEEIL